VNREKFTGILISDKKASLTKAGKLLCRKLKNLIAKGGQDDRT